MNLILAQKTAISSETIAVFLHYPVFSWFWEDDRDGVRLAKPSGETVWQNSPSNPSIKPLHRTPPLNPSIKPSINTRPSNPSINPVHQPPPSNPSINPLHQTRPSTPSINPVHQTPPSNPSIKPSIKPLQVYPTPRTTLHHTTATIAAICENVLEKSSKKCIRGGKKLSKYFVFHLKTI